ncbi:MAG: hypothetical protein KAI79_09635, partial [Bacteroidales bacterium]|nr:hypothetical protein [Bacteroidales bacterium]
MKKILFLVFSLLIISSGFSQNYLVNKWIKDSTTTLVLTKESSFTLKSTKQNIDWKGKYRKENNKLILCIPDTLKDIRIDSLVYSVESNEPIISFYSENQLISKIKRNEQQPKILEIEYTINKISADSLILVGST